MELKFLILCQLAQIGQTAQIKSTVKGLCPVNKDVDDKTPIAPNFCLLWSECWGFSGAGVGSSYQLQMPFVPTSVV